MRGIPFTREQLLSGAVIPGGDNPFPTSDPSTRAHDRQLCDLLECLFGLETMDRFLIQHHLDPAAVRGCFEKWCKQRLGPPSDNELREREGIAAAPSKGGSVTASPLSNELIALLLDIVRKTKQ